MTLLLMVCIVFGVAACGPEKSDADEDALLAGTLQIAADFLESGDAARARVQLQNLDVANPTQWLLYLAETNVSTGADAAQTASLVRLALGIGLQSAVLVDYATANDLLASIPGANVSKPSAAQVAAVNQTDNVGDSSVAVPAAVENPNRSAAGEGSATATPEPEETIPVAVILAPTSTTSDAGDTIAAPAASESSDESEQPAAIAPNAEESTAAELPTPTQSAEPQARANSAMNVRGGPGTVYPIVGAMAANDQAEIVAKNAQSDWWQVRLPDGQFGWVYGPLVQATGDTGAIAVATDIPAPPPTPTPQPVVEAPPAEAPPADPPAEPPPPANDGPDFRVLEKRLWDVYENGGQLSGPTVICGEKRQLVVVVVDANGNRINGVAVQEQYGAKEIHVTGAQGKGDGVVEFILGRGQDVKVIRDADGREVTSELAAGLSTEPGNISYQDLIAGRYCTDDASCKKFVDAPGCWGHYSWTVTFQRNY